MQTKFGILIVLTGVLAIIAGCNIMVTATDYISAIDPAVRFTSEYNEALSAKNTGNILLDIGVYLAIAGIITVVWKRRTHRKRVDNPIEPEQISEVS